MKFNVVCYKKNGSVMKTLKIKDGQWVDPTKPEDYKQLAKEGALFYPGTLVRNVYHEKIKQLDMYKQCGGSPPPWAKPETVMYNEELFAIENLYEKLEQAKQDGDQVLVKKYSSPLVKWFCPIDLRMKCIYPAGKTISNRNDRSDFIVDNLNRFEQAIEEIIEIYLEERISTIKGQAALQNLLSAQFQFRVGNNEKNEKTGTGVTTFQPKHLIFDDKKNELTFKFVGKKHVSWKKKFKPKNEFEQFMYDDLKELCNKNGKYVFEVNGKRVNSIDANILLRQAFKTTKEEEKYLSFHAYRHRKASLLFKEYIESEKFKKSIKKGFDKIEKGKSKNKELRKAQLIQRELKQICVDKIADELNDTPQVVFVTYAGGKIFKNVYARYNIEYDEKKRTFIKTQFEKG